MKKFNTFIIKLISLLILFAISACGNQDTRLSCADIDKLENLVKENKDSNSSDAAALLGMCYYAPIGGETGKSKEQDFEKAFKWFEKAANMGNITGKTALAYMYYKGLGVTKNLSEAFTWCKASATQGNIAAQHALAYMYYNGIGTVQNFPEAIRLYQIASDNGKADARYVLSLMYANGEGVERNIPKAIEILSSIATLEDGDRSGYEVCLKSLKRDGENGTILCSRPWHTWIDYILQEYMIVGAFGVFLSHH